MKAERKVPAMPVTLSANAKINLFLDLGGVLKNGYHGIWTVMQSIDLADRITVDRTEKGIAVSCSDARIPTGEKNIAYKAAALFLETVGSDEGVSVCIEKKIPSQAGLGGGSADAAGTLRALNVLFGNPLSDRALAKIAFRCGADVPFCLDGGMGLCQNMGEIIAPLPSLKDVFIVVAKPQAGVSTAEAYAAYDSAVWVRRADREQFLYFAATGNTPEILRRCSNLFEQFIEVPGRADIKSVMRKYHAKAACMSGSGSAVYGIFTDLATAESCAQELKDITNDVFVCRPVESAVIFAN